MLNRLLLLATVALPGGLAAPAAASGADASANLTIAARVEPFCRLTAEHPDQLQLIDGRAEIGSVREVCNTAAGYEVRAHFSNLAGGTVTAGSDSAVVDPLGGATFSFGEARHQRRLWSLRNAVLRQHGGPVMVRLSITPL